MWLKAFYKLGQLFGMAATSFIAYWLIGHPHFEPNFWIRNFEIIGSIIAAFILGMDILGFHPASD